MNKLICVVQAVMVLFFAACGANNAPSNRPMGGDEGASKAITAVPDEAERKKLAAQGADVFAKFGCATCHSKTAERDGYTGPPLGKAAERHLTRQKGDELAARRWFYSHIRNPEGHPGVFHDDGAYKAAKMPAFPQIPDDELRALVEFLMTMR